MSVLRDGIRGIAIKALSLGAGFLTVAVLAQAMPPEVYGRYAVALATITVLTVPTALGLPNYVVREVSKAVDTRNPRLAQHILGASVLLVLGVSALVVAASVLWSVRDVVGLSPGATTYETVFLIGLGLVPAMALTQVVGAALRGIGENTFGLAVTLVLRQGVFLAFLVVWIAFAPGLAAETAMALHVAAASVALLVSGVWWFAKHPRAKTHPPAHPPVHLRSMLTSAGVLGLVAGAQTVNTNLDVIMLGALRDAQSAGIYKVASMMALLSVAGLQVINLVLMPRFAKAYQAQDHGALQTLATRSVRMILIATLPVSLLLILGGGWIISTAFGDAYVAGYAPMVVLTLGQLVGALFGSVIVILNMTGHETDTLKGVLLGTLFNVALNLLLVPPFGATGAAVATAVTLCVWNAFLHGMVRKRLGVNPTPFQILNMGR